MISLPGGGVVSRCEASLTTVIAGNALLRSLTYSQDKTERMISGKLIKMAACIMLTTQGHGNYSSSK